MSFSVLRSVEVETGCYQGAAIFLPRYPNPFRIASRNVLATEHLYLCSSIRNDSQFSYRQYGNNKFDYLNQWAHIGGKSALTRPHASRPDRPKSFKEPDRGSIWLNRSQGNGVEFIRKPSPKLTRRDCLRRSVWLNRPFLPVCDKCTTSPLTGRRQLRFTMRCILYGSCVAICTHELDDRGRPY